SHGPFGPKEAALIGVDVARASGAVHAAGLLHRDIKASNVMREEGGRILLMDFGLTHHAIAEGDTAGTLKYMAPELLAGKPASIATDIYAIGVLLFHLLTGKYPQRRLLDVRPDLPERLSHVVETAIDPDPAKRYASTGQLIAALSESVGITGAPAVAP